MPAASSPLQRLGARRTAESLVEVRYTVPPSATELTGYWDPTRQVVFPIGDNPTPLAIGTGAGEVNITEIGTSAATTEAATPASFLQSTILEVPVQGDTAATANRPIVGQPLTSATGYTVNPTADYATIQISIDTARINQYNDVSQRGAVITENLYTALYTTDGSTPSLSTLNGRFIGNEVEITLLASELSALRIVGNQDPTSNGHNRAQLKISEYQGTYPGPLQQGSPPNLPDTVNGESAAQNSVVNAYTVATLAASTQIAAANPNRTGLHVSNQTNGNFLIRNGTAAGTAMGQWAYRITPSEDRLLPVNFTGAVFGILEAGASGSGVVVEELS